HIVDTPLSYAPAYGPEMAFTVTYNQREDGQPAGFATNPNTGPFSNLGPQWTFNWMAWVQDNPGDATANPAVHLRGGGTRVYEYDGAGGYNRELRGATQLVRTSSSPIRYEKTSEDGSVEAYSEEVVESTEVRRVLLKEVHDPQGNVATLNYDTLKRLTSITDATGNAMAFSY